MDLTDKVRSVFRERDGFQVDRDGDAYIVRRAAMQCLYFIVRAVGRQGSAAAADKMEIAVYDVSRCGTDAESASGRKLMHLLDTLASTISAHAIVLMDFSRVQGCSGVSLSHLLILATGQTYYNQFDYMAMTAPVDEEEHGDTLNSVHFRAVEDKAEERAVRLHNQQIIDRPLSDFIAPSLLHATAAAAFFNSRGLDLGSATTRQLFSEIIHPSASVNLCGNHDLKMWVRAVIKRMFLPAKAAPLQFRGEHMIKPVAHYGGGIRATNRRRRPRHKTMVVVVVGGAPSIMRRRRLRTGTTHRVARTT